MWQTEIHTDTVCECTSHQQRKYIANVSQIYKKKTTTTTFTASTKTIFSYTHGVISYNITYMNVFKRKILSISLFVIYVHIYVYCIYIFNIIYIYYELMCERCQFLWNFLHIQIGIQLNPLNSKKNIVFGTKLYFLSFYLVQ